MNCSQQTNGAHVAATNMTTLLQKNCIKTLQMNNGSVVVVGTTPVTNIPITQQAQMINANVVPITSAVMSNASGATHTMIANTSHLQPIQAFQYQQIQTVSAPSQPQYLIINPNDGTVFRPIVTTSTQPTTAQIVNNTIYHQTPQTFVTQNNLPKIGAIKYTNSASTQQKVLNIVTSLKSTPQHHHQLQQHQQQTQNINTTNNIVGPQPHIINNKTISQHNNSHTFINSGGQQQQQQQQQQQRRIVSIANGDIGNTINNIMNTSTTSNQIVTSLNNTVYTAAHAAISNQQIIATTAKSNSFHTETVNIKNNNCKQMSIQSTTMKNESNTTSSSSKTIIQKTIENVPVVTSNAGSLTTVKEEQIEAIQEKIIQTEQCQPSDEQQHQLEQSENPIEEENEPEPEIDIVINNVVCSFSVRCHLNLRQIALNGRNVEFRRENGMVTMKLRRPYTTASIWSSGRITCTGATSEDQAKVGARRYARCLQKLGFPARFNHFRVVNVLGTCSMPWAIKIVNFSEKYKQDASYEPELHPGVTYKLKTPKATLKIFSTGSITVTAASVADVQTAIEHIFPLVYEFRKKRTAAAIPPPIEALDSDNEIEFIGDMGSSQRHVGSATGNPIPRSKKAIKRKYPFGHSENDPHEDNMIVSDDELWDKLLTATK